MVERQVTSIMLGWVAKGETAKGEKAFSLNRIKQDSYSPLFSEADNLYSAAPFVPAIIRCEYKKDPSVVQTQPPPPSRQLPESGRLTMS